jgi:RNA 3'-phosphate cyclase
MIDIDGSYLEGGGQIVRTAIALSAVTSEPVRLYNIRAGRKKPGLKPQHLSGIRAVSKISNAAIEGLSLGSKEVVFTPGRISGGEYVIDTKTAGAITLILQVLVPVGIYASSPLKMKIKGGTAVSWSPTILYFKHIFCHFLKMIGVLVFVDIERHGFYPRGGGVVSLEIIQGKLKNLELIHRGKLLKVDVIAISSNHLKSARVGERLISGFRKVFPDANIKIEYVDSFSPGCFVHSNAHFEFGKIGADTLGKRGKRAEDVGLEAALNLRKEIETGAPIDDWMVDQLIPYMALATYLNKLESIIRIPCLTRHAETNIWVVKKFLPVDFKEEGNLLICAAI